MKKKSKLNIRYHNPNSEDVTAAYIAQIFTEASKAKFEKVLQESLSNMPQSQRETA